VTHQQLQPTAQKGNRRHQEPDLQLQNILRQSYDYKGSPYSSAERRVPELIPVLGSQPAGDESHKPGGKGKAITFRRPADTLATFKRAATISVLGEQKYDGCKQFA